MTGNQPGFFGVGSVLGWKALLKSGLFNRAAIFASPIVGGVPVGSCFTLPFNGLGEPINAHETLLIKEKNFDERVFLFSVIVAFWVGEPEAGGGAASCGVALSALFWSSTPVVLFVRFILMIPS